VPSGLGRDHAAPYADIQPLALLAMDLTIVGCSGSFPGPDSAASCYLIEADGFRLVVDLGNGALGSLQRYVALDRIDAVCISHLHADHCLDMCSYQVFRAYHPSGQLPPIPVYGPSGTLTRLDRATAIESPSPMATIGDRFGFVALAPGTIEIGPLRVTLDRVNHPVETYGFRFEHNGHAVAYSADTGPCEQLVRLADGADVLICEASFVDADGLPTDVHLTARQAGEHAARAGAGELILTHLVPWNSAEEVFAQAASAYQGAISLARPGVVVKGPQ
jgi:ribonuclease BN (tRNA processing enzyme)